MRIDPNWIIFTKDSSWYTFEKGVGYIPTDKAPEEAVKAMQEYNRYTFNTKHPNK